MASLRLLRLGPRALHALQSRDRGRRGHAGRRGRGGGGERKKRRREKSRANDVVDPSMVSLDLSRFQCLALFLRSLSLPRRHSTDAPRGKRRSEALHSRLPWIEKKQKTLRSSNSTCSARAARPASLPAASRAPPRPAPQPPLLLPRPRATTRSSTSGGERCSPRPAASP